MKHSLICCSTLTVLAIVVFTAVPDLSLAQARQNTISEITIGEQVWMSANLSVGVFSNGDTIPQKTTDEEWLRASKSGQAAWCFYDNDPANETHYGRLYNWHAVSDPRGICPSGWHMPSDMEWTQLENHLGGSKVAGGKLKAVGAGIWKGANADASDAVGFSAMPAGFRQSDRKQYFGEAGSYTVWWSSRQKLLSVLVYTRAIRHSDSKLIRGMAHMNSGVSVRCIKGEPPSTQEKDEDN